MAPGTNEFDAILEFDARRLAAMVMSAYVHCAHLCRALFKTSNHRLLLPTSAILGALLALSADLVARLPGSQATLPLNAVTSLIGAPVVTWIILRRHNLHQSFAA